MTRGFLPKGEDPTVNQKEQNHEQSEEKRKNLLTDPGYSPSANVARLNISDSSLSGPTENLKSDSEKIEKTTADYQREADDWITNAKEFSKQLQPYESQNCFSYFFSTREENAQEFFNFQDTTTSYLDHARIFNEEKRNILLKTIQTQGYSLFPALSNTRVVFNTLFGKLSQLQKKLCDEEKACIKEMAAVNTALECQAPDIHALLDNKQPLPALKTIKELIATKSSNSEEKTALQKLILEKCIRRIQYQHQTLLATIHLTPNWEKFSYTLPGKPWEGSSHYFAGNILAKISNHLKDRISGWNIQYSSNQSNSPISNFDDQFGVLQIEDQDYWQIKNNPGPQPLKNIARNFPSYSHKYQPRDVFYKQQIEREAKRMLPSPFELKRPQRNLLRTPIAATTEELYQIVESCLTKLNQDIQAKEVFLESQTFFSNLLQKLPENPFQPLPALTEINKWIEISGLDATQTEEIKKLILMRAILHLEKQYSDLFTILKNNNWSTFSYQEQDPCPYGSNTITYQGEKIFPPIIQHLERSVKMWKKSYEDLQNSSSSTSETFDDTFAELYSADQRYQKVKNSFDTQNQRDRQPMMTFYREYERCSSPAAESSRMLASLPHQINKTRKELEGSTLTRIFHHFRDEKVAKADGVRQTKDFDQGCMSTYCPDQNSSLTQHPSDFPAFAVERDEIFGLTQKQELYLCFLEKLINENYLSSLYDVQFYEMSESHIIMDTLSNVSIPFLLTAIKENDAQKMQKGYHATIIGLLRMIHFYDIEGDNNFFRQKERFIQKDSEAIALYLKKFLESNTVHQNTILDLSTQLLHQHEYDLKNYANRLRDLPYSHSAIADLKHLSRVLSLIQSHSSEFNALINELESNEPDPNFWLQRIKNSTTLMNEVLK